MYVFLLRDRKGSLSALKNFLIFNERYEAGCRDLNPWHGVELGVLPIMLISICSRLYLDSTRTEATLPMIPKRPTPSWKWLLYYSIYCTAQKFQCLGSWSDPDPTGLYDDKTRLFAIITHITKTFGSKQKFVKNTFANLIPFSYPTKIKTNAIVFRDFKRSSRIQIRPRIQSLKG